MKNIQARVMNLVHDTSSQGALQMYEVTVIKLWSGHDFVMDRDQREITPKLSKLELWVLCMTHHLIVLYNCMKFQPNRFNRVQLTERT